MVKPTFRGCDRPDLLPFEEVRRRLGLMTRLPVGRREVSIDDIIGSVGRATDFDGCFRPRGSRLRIDIAERAANPAVIDMPISLLQVDHAYFVEDGHKRLSMAIASGRKVVDADVDRFQTDLHLAPGTTMASIRATAKERRFRRVTGLDVALPRRRFALSDPDGYLELQESVKAHTLDLSRSEGRLVAPDEGARHWYDTVFAPILEILEANGTLRLLETMTDADRFLLSGAASTARWTRTGRSRPGRSKAGWPTCVDAHLAAASGLGSAHWPAPRIAGWCSWSKNRPLTRRLFADLVLTKTGGASRHRPNASDDPHPAGRATIPPLNGGSPLSRHHGGGTVRGPQIQRALSPDPTHPALGGAHVRRIVWRSTLVATVAAMLISATVLAAPAGTNNASTEASVCAALYSVPVNVGPDPLSACSWDMRAIGATPAGSYAVNRGAGARVGDIDTGIDLTNTDIMPNVDLSASCVFLYSSTPTANPAEQVTRGDCSNKAALQDLAGHGTHTAGTIAAPINGKGVAGVAPEAKVVVLKAGTEQGYFFTQSVVDALRYAGDQRLDVVNMSFFADPWLFNCRNDTEQRAIIAAISAAARYAQQRGVVLVAAAGNDGIDLNHPITDEISPDFPPGAAVSRPVNNSCVVLPTEIPGVVVVTATGAENLLSWFSTYGNVTDVTAPGGSRFQTPTFDSARGRVLSTYSSTASDLAVEAALGRLVQDADGNYYAWLNGTSMAAPHAAGVVALIRSAHPSMPVGSVVAMLRSTATNQGCPAALDPGVEFFGAPVQHCAGGTGSNNFYGAGLVNALAASN